MRRVTTLALVACLITAAMSCALAAQRTPPGSYLTYRATTVGELLQQVSTDTTARARYARHFGISPENVVSYFKQNLSLVSLKRPVKVTSWYLNRSGKISHKVKLLPKGTLVFARKDGTPMLAWSCGNPLNSGVDKAAAPGSTTGSKVGGVSDAVAGSTESAAAPAAADPAITQQTSQAVEQTALAPQGIETKIMPNPAETVAAAAVTVPPTFAAETVPAVVVAAQPGIASPGLAAAALPSVAVAPVIAAAGGGGFGIAGALAGIGGLAALAGGGGGGGGGPAPSPVPEPSGLAAMALGMGAILPAFRRSLARR